MHKAVLLLLPIPFVLAQHHDMPMPPEKPVALYKGLGTWRRPIATRSPEAQKFFDQGLTLLYGFNRYEALRSFRKASELDPAAPMPFWGMAMAQGPYINMDGDPSFDNKSACAAVESGRKMADIGEHERMYLDAVSAFCPEYRPADYTAAMRSLKTRYPDDLDALTLFAESLMIPVRWRWYAADGSPAEGMPEAERALEEVLRRWPDHPGANHYYIHAVESSKTPERAIPSAQRLMGITPAAGHMVHMPGHVWLVTGDWESAASVNERAATVDREYFAATNVNGTYTPYYLHNLHFIYFARSMQGRKGDTLQAARTLTTAAEPIIKAFPDWADSIAPTLTFAYARFGEWDAILKMPPPPDTLKVTTALWRYARTLALAARGDRAAAERERKAFDAARGKIPADQPWGQNKTGPVLELASEILAARIARSPEESLGHWRRAVEIEGGLTYDEPPAWYYPLRESWGAALVRAGRAAEAEEVLREGVRRSPHNGRMLFGLMESLKAQRKTQEADWVKREFEAAWSRADVQLRLEDL
jgi:tetratricopeptide (TPR) repeat protein